MAAKTMTIKEAEEIILDLSKKGKSSEKIGIVLKEDYHIKNFKKTYGKKISDITNQRDADVKNVSKKVETLQLHLDKNKKDQPARRRLIQLAAKLKKLKKIQEDKTNKKK